MSKRFVIDDFFKENYTHYAVFIDTENSDNEKCYLNIEKALDG